MKLADYSQRVTADQLDTALRQGGFEGVFHYLSGTFGYVLRIEDPAIVADIRTRGWPQAGIDTPTLAGVDGVASAARVRSVYGFSEGFRHYLDIEPSQFNANPSAWPAAADGWCDAVRSAGLSPGVYGTDQTLAACANHADTIWRIAANTGTCDPAAPGKQGLNSAFFAGRRAIQCNAAIYNGIEFDVNYSQFSISVLPSEEIMVIRNPADGAVYVVGEEGKRHIGGLEYAAWRQTLGYSEVAVDTATVAEIPDVSAPPAVDVNALATALATHPLTATLSDAERDAVATHVLQHLSKDTAAG